MRINSLNDWGRIDWKKGKFLDTDETPVYYDAIIINFHGGGFLSGSSATSRGQSFSYTIETGLPVFTIDYRLAPENKFPDALND